MDFANKNSDFKQVLAGKISIEDFFKKEAHKKTKDKFMDLFNNTFKDETALSKDCIYPPENVAAAWITKLRYNEKLDDATFIKFINHSSEIFNSNGNGNGNEKTLNLKSNNKDDNDLCAIMWGIEALNGVQSFDSGATRVRLTPGVAPKIVDALIRGGAVEREHTHATGTKISAKGLGKDIANEQLRAYTPRGVGSLLVIPTSLCKKKSEDKKDYDLLLKREDYGYKDNKIHSFVHSKVGFINYLTNSRNQFKQGMALISKKSPLALNAEKDCGGPAPKTHRKEHLSELKDQSATLVSLLEAGKKQNLFPDFKITWAFRMKWPPFEKKIIATAVGDRKGLGEFLSQLSVKATENEAFQKANKDKLEEVKGLLEQAKKGETISHDFKKCREGNEVLVYCDNNKAVLIDKIAKCTEDSPVDRMALIASNVTSETNPDTKEHTTAVKNNLRELRASGNDNSSTPENGEHQPSRSP